MPNRNLVKHHGTLGAAGPQGGTLYASAPMSLARDSRLSPAARSIAFYMWSHGEKWHQSAEDIAEKLGMTAKTVRAGLACLQECGWLIRQNFYNSGKKKPAFQVWHMQLTNIPFTPEQVAALSEPRTIEDSEGSVKTTDEGREKLPTRVGKNYLGGSVKTTDHSSAASSAPEVHYRSGSNPVGPEQQAQTLTIEDVKPPKERLNSNGVNGRGQGRSLSVNSSDSSTVTTFSREGEPFDGEPLEGLRSLTDLAAPTTFIREESREQAAARLRAELAEGPIYYSGIWDRYRADEIEFLTREGVAEVHQESESVPWVLRLVDPANPPATIFDPFGGVEPDRFASHLWS